MRKLIAYALYLLGIVEVTARFLFLLLLSIPFLFLVVVGGRDLKITSRKPKLWEMAHKLNRS